MPSPATIHTVVGSSVAVCVWDRTLEIGAMNHFHYPMTCEQDKATPLYGNVATAELLRMMFEAGAQRDTMSAQIVGGAGPEPGSPSTLGMENVVSARAVLTRAGIVIKSEDIGGSMGRKVIFDIKTGHILILKVHHLRQDDWGVYYASKDAEDSNAADWERDRL